MRELQTILQELRQIFTFISLHVFNSNGGLMNLLGHFIWGGENGLEFRLKVLIEVAKHIEILTNDCCL